MTPRRQAKINGEPGHTKGLWVATERSGFHEILAPDENCDWYGHAKMHAVAYIDTEIPEGEAEANALLIAAAPMLLDGAQDAVEAFKLLRMGLGGLKGVPDQDKALEVINAHIDELEYAIAGATGVPS